MRETNSSNFNIKDQAFFQPYKIKGFAGHKKQPHALAWNYTGNYLISAESSIKLWGFNESYDLFLLHDGKGHDSFISHASFFNINIFATMSKDQLKLWDIRENGMKSIRTEKKIKSDFISFTWNHELHEPQFTILLKDGTISTLDIRSNSLAQSLNTTKSSLELNEIIWDQKDNVLIASGTESGTGFLTLFDDKLNLLNETFQIHNGRINSFCIDKNNDFLVTCSEDSLVEKLALPDFICENAYSHTDTAYKQASISGNSEFLAVSCDEPVIHLYNLKKGGHSFEMKVNSSSQQSLSWHPEKLILAYIDEDDKRKDKTQDCYIKLFCPN